MSKYNAGGYRCHSLATTAAVAWKAHDHGIANYVLANSLRSNPCSSNSLSIRSAGLGDEKLMYSLLKDLGATVISVGNRPSLLPFHTRVLRLKGDGEWSVETPDEAAANAE